MDTDERLHENRQRKTFVTQIHSAQRQNAAALAINDFARIIRSRRLHDPRAIDRADVRPPPPAVCKDRATWRTC